MSEIKNNVEYKVEHNGNVYEVDEGGFLLNPDDWDLDWVDYVRTKEGIDEVTEDHHSIIDDLREYNQKYGTSPMVRFFFKHTNFSLKRIYELFPSGPGEGACKMAGLRMPFYLHQISSCR